MADLTGQIINRRYKVEAFLGRGGMAEVYKVWDEQRATHLALKLLHADLSRDRFFLRRFQREASNLMKLQHPNIVRFYGLEQDDLLSNSLYGVQDMAGSVFEWTSSLYKPYPYDSNDGREDPSVNGDRVQRGGDAQYLWKNIRSAYRIGRLPSGWDYNLGFRCVFRESP